MLLIPKGLLPRTRHLPIATTLICVITAFYSIFTFHNGKEARDFFWHSKHRQKFAKQAQQYLMQKCSVEQAKSYCQGLGEIPLKVYLLEKHRLPWLKERLPDSHLIDYISDELSPKRLQAENPGLYALYESSEEDKRLYTIQHQLLSYYNIHWYSAIRSLFTHSSYTHLIGNLLLLLFLAFPVEERMGFLGFTFTYLFSGILGSVFHVFVSHDTFYIVGASSAVMGIAGAYTYLFWRQWAQVKLYLIFMKSQTLKIPVYLYAPTFLLASLAIDAFDPLTHTAHLAHVTGFLLGILVGIVYTSLRPLPKYYTYSYELKLANKVEANLSQYERLKAYVEWLYLSPVNLEAFKRLSQEITRSDSNPKVKKLMQRFRKHVFPTIYSLYKNDETFLKSLPVDWLGWLPVDQNLKTLQSLFRKFETNRDFKSAFKVCFLILNQVGWNDETWSVDLYKNWKKSSIDKSFNKEVAKLMDRHSMFKRQMAKYPGFKIHSA